MFAYPRALKGKSLCTISQLAVLPLVHGHLRLRIRGGFEFVAVWFQGKEVKHGIA